MWERLQPFAAGPAGAPEHTDREAVVDWAFRVERAALTAATRALATLANHHALRLVLADDPDPGRRVFTLAGHPADTPLRTFRIAIDFASSGAPERVRTTLTRILRPPGLWLAFLGPDGTGKSTVADALVAQLEPLFRSVERHHLRPQLLAPSQTAGPVTEPHAAQPRGALGSLAKLVLWWLDSALGFALRIHPARVRGALVVFDRQIWDLWVDPLRYRYGGPHGLTAALCRAAPCPYLFLVLDAPREVIHARKQEVSAAEVDRQRAAYRALAARLPGAVVVDVARSVPEVTAGAVDVVLRHLEQRTHRRLGLEPPLTAADR